MELHRVFRTAPPSLEAGTRGSQRPHGFKIAEVPANSLPPPIVRLERHMEISAIGKSPPGGGCIDHDQHIAAHGPHIRKNLIEIVFFDMLENIDIDEKVCGHLRLGGISRNSRVVPVQIHRISKIEPIQQDALTAPIVHNGLRFSQFYLGAEKP